MNGAILELKALKPWRRLYLLIFLSSYQEIKISLFLDIKIFLNIFHKAISGIAAFIIPVAMGYTLHKDRTRYVSAVKSTFELFISKVP